MKVACITFIVLMVTVVAIADESVVETPLGAVTGVVTAKSRSFKNIPFAESPTGQLRFASPVMKRPWSPKILPGESYGPGCPQRCNGPMFTCPDTFDEDCLQLNIFTPRVGSFVEPAPVMVWWSGGRFEGFGAPTRLYDSGDLVNRSGVIVVTANYRLGALGWAYSDATPPNLGLEDQRMALMWVRQNIRAFGGDPNLVTVFGQSAGATSIATHLISPKSAGLFHRAIMQSGPLALPNKPAADARWHGNEWVKLVGCKTHDIQCLRSATIDQILDAQAKANQIANITKPLQLAMPWVPTVIPEQGDVLGQPLDLIAAGRFHKIPIITGTTFEEGQSYVYEIFKKPIGPAEYYGILMAVFQDAAPQVISRYPIPSNFKGDPRDILQPVATAYIFQCPNRVVARSYAGNGVNAWLYDFNTSISYDGWGPRHPYCVGHPCHGVDLPYLFDTAKVVGYQPTPEEEALSRYHGAFWTNLARTGDPNRGTQQPPLTWPVFRSNSNVNLEMLAPNGKILTDFRKSDCDFFDSIGYHHGW